MIFETQLILEINQCLDLTINSNHYGVNVIG